MAALRVVILVQMGLQIPVVVVVVVQPEARHLLEELAAQADQA